MASLSTASSGRNPHAPAASDHMRTSPTTPTHSSRNHSIPSQQSGDTFVNMLLEAYQDALGIKAPKDSILSKILCFTRPPKNTRSTDQSKRNPSSGEAHKGIYPQVVSWERQANLSYKVCNIFLCCAMFLQIVIGAALTAFGAGKVNHTIVTVFGAANTAIASILAVLKSRGLPNRLRQDWIEWVELRRFIEQKEMDIRMATDEKFGLDSSNQPTPGSVGGMIKEIELKYNAVRLTCEANRPDTYVKVPPQDPPQNVKVPLKS